MKFGIGAKVFVLALLIVSIPTTILFLYARSDIEQKTLASIESNLRHRVQLGLVSQPSWPSSREPSDDWQRLVRGLSRASGTRVSIIRRDGLLLADSEIDNPKLERDNNHRLRPEVQAALSVGVGAVRRHSQTIGRDLFYVAVPYGDPSEPSGVLRMAQDLSAVEREVAQLQKSVSVGSILALLLALATAGGTALWVSRSARYLTAAARRMSEGDLETKIPEIAHDELGELGRTLETLAQSLSTTLSELRSERDWMGAILSRMREGVLLLDAAQCIKMLNPSMREMLLLNDNVVGMPLLEAIRHSELKKLLDHVFAKGEPATREIEVSGLKPRRLLVRAAPLGRDAAVFAVVFDVTEMRRLESLRKDFVANVSHELRTPVTAIRSAAETLRDVAVKDVKALPSFVDIVVRNAERLGSLVDDLLELSRIESRELRLVPELVKLDVMVAHIVSLFDERARKRRQEFDVEVPDDTPLVLADRRALDLVLNNLIDNAVKYSGSNSVIRVRATGGSSGVTVLVEDTGPGIAEEHLPRLFERFYRIDTGRSRDQGGTGLGLSIVRHMVEAMGSHIAVDSTVGVGTRFTFELPIAATLSGDNAGLPTA